MPFYEGRHCDDCGHDWDEIDLSESVTVGTIDYKQENTYTLYTCPQCNLRLRVQRETDLNSWRHWVRTLPNSPTDAGDRLMVELAGRISAILADLRSAYQPTIILLESIDCTKCNARLVLGPLVPPPPVCPECGSTRSSAKGGWGHVSLWRE
jgi:Zn finger protein HypA/HybF involved in hydrogenase expression